MNLLIVEDEIRLCNSLAHNIPWEDHGIEVIGMAYTGTEAIRMIERKRPDIVLLDIQIPEMDGLTLARKVRELDPLIKMIVLSGHDNFAFARTALEVGVVKYLLKPAGDEEVMKAVLDAAEMLRRELDERHNMELLKQQWQLHLPHLRNNFFLNWIGGKYEQWEWLQRARELQIDVSANDRYAVAVMDMDPLPEGETRFSAKDGPLLQFALNSMVRELTQNEACWVCSDAHGLTIVLFRVSPDAPTNEAMLAIHTTVSRLLAKIKECLKLTASAGISAGAGNWDELPNLFRQAEKALQNRVVYGCDLAIPYREQKSRLPVIPVQPNLEKQLEIALETGDAEKAEQLIELLWKEGAKNAETVDDIHENFLYLNSLLIRTIQKQGWLVKEAAGGDYLYFRNLQRLTSQEQIVSWLTKTVRNIAAFAQTQRRSANGEIVRAILNIVEKEMDKDISLHTVADRLYINPSYLSRLFKQETGKPFSAYVLERKMERAKAALLEGAKVYDAAATVGYRDVSYFTKVFRKYWGVTPGEMRP